MTESTEKRSEYGSTGLIFSDCWGRQIMKQPERQSRCKGERGRVCTDCCIKVSKVPNREEMGNFLSKGVITCVKRRMFWIHENFLHNSHECVPPNNLTSLAMCYYRKNVRHKMFYPPGPLKPHIVSSQIELLKMLRRMYSTGLKPS